MGKNRNKNKKKQEKRIQKNKEHEKNLKLELEQKQENLLKYSNTDQLSSAESENQCATENWDDEGESHWEKVVAKKKTLVKCQTEKNRNKNVESMEVDGQRWNENGKKNKQTNSLQDFDHVKKCAQTEWPENFSSTSEKDSSQKHKRNHSSHGRNDSRNRNGDCSSHQRTDFKLNGQHDRNVPSNYRNSHSNHHQNEHYDRNYGKGHSHHQKDTRNGENRRRNSRHSDRNSAGGDNRRPSNYRYSHSNHHQNEHYHDRNDGKGQSYHQKDARNGENHCRSSRQSDGNFAGGDNRRNETPNDPFNEDRNDEPSQRRLGQGNQNSFENGNKLCNNKITRQKRKKKNKTTLFLPNADCYEPTIREVQGDLFESSEEYSLAHCVAEDLSMSAGIAVEFKKRFKGVRELLKQNRKVGQVAILQKNNRFIFYLITKRQSYGKPTINSIATAINSLKQLCLGLNVKKLAIPRIGCGLDRLDWDEVKAILYDEFSTTDIEIIVYVW